MSTDTQGTEVQSALATLQRERPRDGEPTFSWLDERKETVVEVLNAYGPKRTSELLALPLNALNTWRRRRGLQDNRSLGNSKAHSRIQTSDEEAASPESIADSVHLPVGAPGEYGVQEIDPDLILPNPWQPRRQAQDEYIRELADSIDQNGLLQIPLGRARGTGQVEIAFGHSRVDAIRLLKAEGRWPGGAPMVLRDLTDEEMVVFAFEENAKRKDLTQYEEIRGYEKALAEVSGLTITALAQRLGIDRSTLSNHLRILRLPQVVLDRVESGELSPHAAREFLCLMNDDHAHEDDMAWGIRTITTTGIRDIPDWRVENVRFCIRDRVRHTNYEGWRPVNDSSYVKPTFDVESYKSERPEWVHNIPDFRSTLAWTCNVREWRRLQSAGTRGLNRAQAENAPGLESNDEDKQALALSNEPKTMPTAVESEVVVEAHPVSWETGQVQTHANQEPTLPTPYYLCSSISCTSDAVFWAQGLLWWPGDSTYSPGWYCEDCVSNRMLLDAFNALTRLTTHLSPYLPTTIVPWPGEAVELMPTFTPSALYLCNRCESAFEESLLEWDPEAVQWLCDGCN